MTNAPIAPELLDEILGGNKKRNRKVSLNKSQEALVIQMSRVAVDHWIPETADGTKLVLSDESGLLSQTFSIAGISFSALGSGDILANLEITCNTSFGEMANIQLHEFSENLSNYLEESFERDFSLPNIFFTLNNAAADGARIEPIFSAAG